MAPEPSCVREQSLAWRVPSELKRSASARSAQADPQSSVIGNFLEQRLLFAREIVKSARVFVNFNIILVILNAGYYAAMAVN